MPRIRTIKPEFCQSESMGNVSREARLTFVLLWPHCDDYGRARASSRALASTLYPFDDDAPKLINGWLDELEREHCIQRYEVDGKHYLQVTNWLHQKIDHPSKPLYPEPSRALTEPSPNPRAVSGIRDQGKESKSTPLVPPKGGNTNRRQNYRAQLPEECPSQNDQTLAIQYWGTRARFDLNTPEALSDQIAKFRAHHEKLGSLMANWSAAWRTWYLNAPERTKPNGQGHGKSKPTATDRHLAGIAMLIQEKRNPS